MKVASLVVRVVLLGLVISAITAGSTYCQIERGSAPALPAWRENHTPRKALVRAVAVPGWGQLYNRQYLKVPIVYLVLGGLTANTIRVNNKYLLYRHAYQYQAFEEIVADGEPNPRAQFEQDYNELVAKSGGFSLSAGTIRPSRDALRRNRDLSVVGIGLAYGLTILDAFVSAHLLDFDVGEDLLVSVEPTQFGIQTRLIVKL